MLKTQQQFIEYTHQLNTLLKGSEFDWDKTLPARIEKTELLVPVIGVFSVGKSSILNTFLGMDVLPVGIAPETELATELHFSPEPWLQAIKHDGSEVRLPVEDLAVINKKTSDYCHLRLYLNCPTLEAIAPLILVDMPGYGSSLENHNKALAYYLPRGVHFIVVTSIEEGTLTQSILRQLDNIKVFNSDFSFILSKVNLRAAEQVKEVSDYIDNQLELYFSAEKHVIPIDNTSSAALSGLLATIDPEILFSNVFLDGLKDQNIDLINQINFSCNVVNNSQSDNHSALQSLELSLDELIRQHNRAQQELKYRYSDPLVTRIINSIDRELNNQLDRLTHLLTQKNAAPALEREIADIIRSNLTKNLKHEMEQISSELVDGIAINLMQNNPVMASLDQNWTQNIADKTESQLKAVSSFFETVSEKFPNKADAGKTYRLISTVFAISTSVLNPVLEIVIVFLPEIIRFFSSFNAEEKARSNLLNSIFPGIKSEMRKALPEIVDEQLNALLNSVSNEFEEQINQQRTLIATYQHEQEQAQEYIDKQIEALQSLSTKLKALATSYLYH
ncbi:GTPase [Paramixta manurensis]|uniref:GTPase n=1 Tax=Paramixta manurensis TaxID=2740817 RepID=A0A6M8U878_9GAMM|nr:GTPase [Erwiniaceae bacterium PD-1]